MDNRIALLVGVFAAACNPDTSVRADGAAPPMNVTSVDCATASPAATVMTLGLAYQPTPTTVARGSVVRFVMPAQHNVTSTTAGLAVPFGGTMCLQFPESGTFTFKCSAHGFMGTVVVTDDPKGPGAALKCTSSGKNAWDTYGAAAFVAVNEEIFRLVGEESTAHGTDNLGDSFTRIGTGIPSAASDGLATFKGKLAAFLVHAYGGPTSITYTDTKTYDGRIDMVVAHQGFGITSAQFDYFIANIVVPALVNKGVSADDISSCFAPVVTSASFKASIVGQ